MNAPDQAFCGRSALGLRQNRRHGNIEQRTEPNPNAPSKRASKHVVITSVDAWVGTLAYTFQIYFDFSGDMPQAAE
jgi:hypothetical protein